MKNKPNRNGEKLINEFCTYLDIGTKDSYDERTIKQYRNDIWEYWEVTNFEDLKMFDTEKAMIYRESLNNIRMQTKKQKLNRVSAFFRWLFTSKLTTPKISEALALLKLSKKEKGLLSKQEIRVYPTFEQFTKLIDFEVKDEIDMRDKALLCFLLLSAGRIDAVRTLPLGALNPDTLDLVQDPTEGVHTKRNKFIMGTLFRFSDEYADIIKNWLKYLKEEKKFCLADPMFPKLVQSQENKAIYVVSKEFYKSQNPINEIIARRFNDKNLPVFSAHEFRHLALDTAFGLARNGKQSKAISQNVGHKNISTTFKQYANMQPQEYMEIIRNLKFEVTEQKRVCELSTSELMELLKRRISIDSKGF